MVQVPTDVDHKPSSQCKPLRHYETQKNLNLPSCTSWQDYKTSDMLSTWTQDCIVLQPPHHLSPIR